MFKAGRLAAFGILAGEEHVLAVDHGVEVERLLLLGGSVRAHQAFVENGAAALVVMGDGVSRFHFDLDRIFGENEG